MAHVTLYRKFRPSTWDKVIGQEHIVTTLKNQIKNDSVAHAYLFTGTRGTGKTSSAKIFAKAVNCMTPVDGSPCGKCPVCLALQNPANLDIIEMDAASNNGIDEIRDLKESAQYPPTVGKYKVYIIDEVHMLSTSAFNALLKTLEEPPAYVIFILATTEVHKLPQTILSRCIRFDFRLVSKNELAALLERIFGEINYKADRRALEEIALHGDGSVRDTLSLAEMCMAYAPNGLSYEQALEVLGASEFDTLFAIADAMLNGNVGSLLSKMNNLYDNGKNASTITKELASFLRDTLTVKNVPNYKASFTDEEYAKVMALAEKLDNTRIGRAMDIISLTENTVKYSTQPKIVLDAALVKAAEMYTDPSVESLNSRVRYLEQRLEGILSGSVAVTSATVNTQKDNSLNLEKKLASQATIVEETPVFDVAPQKPSAEQQEAERIWGRLLTVLRENKASSVLAPLISIENPSLSYNAGALTLTVDNPATINYFDIPGNTELVTKYLAEVVGNSAAFHVVSGKVGKSVPKEDKRKLGSIFAGFFKEETK